MPQFNLKHLRAGKYTNTNGVVTYSDAVEIGDAMTVDLQLTFAEARLYAEGKLAEYLREASGGTASIGVKYIKAAAQTLLFGVRSGSRTVGQATVTSTKLGGNDSGNYVGFSFYCDDMIDGVKKFTCAFVKKARFSYPSMTLQTKGDSITFQTPTTTGAFLPDDTLNQELIEVAVVDDEATARAWCDAVVNFS